MTEKELDELVFKAKRKEENLKLMKALADNMSMGSVTVTIGREQFGIGVQLRDAMIEAMKVENDVIAAMIEQAKR